MGRRDRSRGASLFILRNPAPDSRVPAPDDHGGQRLRCAGGESLHSPARSGAQVTAYHQAALHHAVQRRQPHPRPAARYPRAGGRGGGGGSTAGIDRGGLLKVGPQSPGADPGPACYPDGGALPTVTDADVMLGWLNPEFFVGGKFHLDAAAAARAISPHIAEPLKLLALEAANGIIK